MMEKISQTHHYVEKVQVGWSMKETSSFHKYSFLDVCKKPFSAGTKMLKFTHHYLGESISCEGVFGKIICKFCHCSRQKALKLHSTTAPGAGLNISQPCSWQKPLYSLHFQSSLLLNLEHTLTTSNWFQKLSAKMRWEKKHRIGKSTRWWLNQPK